MSGLQPATDGIVNVSYKQYNQATEYMNIKKTPTQIKFNAAIEERDKGLAGSSVASKGTGKGIEELCDGSFKIKNWDGYPDGPKSDGPFNILEGEEYNSARKATNNANANIHKQDPSLKGMQIHEIHPVKFGGSPTEVSNKIPLTPKEHAKYTTWWNRLLKDLKNNK